MKDEMIIVQGQKVLKRGYTTGTTATGATKYSISLLAKELDNIDFEQKYKDFTKIIDEEEISYKSKVIPIKTIKGITVDVEINDCFLDKDIKDNISVTSVAIKESGDDPDVTHQSKISSTVYFQEKKEFFELEKNINPDDLIPKKYLYAINFDDFSVSDEISEDEALGIIGNVGIIGIYGGSGVGYVTKKGLSPKKSYSAINPKPREMILKELSEVIKKSKKIQSILLNNILLVKICVIDGEEIAKKTFNPKLGIIGGISILGTSGIVEPMSEQALIDTIKTEINQYKELDTKKPLLLCPGNYGQAFAKDKLKLDLDKSVKISNFVGESLDYSVFLGIKNAILIGHAGKLVKIAASVMNTHSSYADARQEVMASHSAIAGAKKETLLTIMNAISIEEMLDALLLEGETIFKETMDSIQKAIMKNINHRTKEKIRIEFIVFTNSHGIVTMSDNAMELLEQLQEEF